MNDDLLEVRTRLLWSSLHEKSHGNYRSLRATIRNRDKLELSSLREALDKISPGLFHLYSWLDNKESRAIYGCSFGPGESFTLFENLQIQLELWRFGEDWEQISLKLFADSHYAARIRNHAAVSGMYSKCDETDFSCAFTGIGFKEFKEKMLNMRLDEAIEFALEMIKFNFLLAPKV